MPDQPPEVPDEHYEHQKRLYAAYQVQRSEADRIALEIGGRYEKFLSLIAGGALAVSVTFIEKIAPTPIPCSRWIALTSWGLLSAAVLSTLFAIAASQRAQQKKIENLDSEILKNLYPDDSRYKDLNVTSNPHVGTVRVANRTSLWCTITGLAALIAFVFVNFPSSKKNEYPHAANSITTIPANSGGGNQKQLLCPDEGADHTASAASETKIDEQKAPINMPPRPNSPPPPNPQTGSPLIETYVPTRNPITPPPPPPPPNPPAPAKPSK